MSDTGTPPPRDGEPQPVALQGSQNGTETARPEQLAQPVTEVAMLDAQTRASVQRIEAFGSILAALGSLPGVSAALTSFGEASATAARSELEQARFERRMKLIEVHVAARESKRRGWFRFLSPVVLFVTGLIGAATFVVMVKYQIVAPENIRAAGVAFVGAMWWLFHQLKQSALQPPPK